MPKTWKPVSDLAKIVNDAGFNDDPDQDILRRFFDRLFE